MGTRGPFELMRDGNRIMLLRFIVYLPAKTTRARNSLAAWSIKAHIRQKGSNRICKRRAEKPFRRKSNIIALRL